MALACSPNSASAANPSCPARELSATTGNMTLMVLLVTPRLEVLAELTGLGPDPPAPVPVPVDGAVVVVLADVELEQAATPMSTAPSTANTRRGWEPARR